MDSQEVAEALGVTIMTVNRWVKSGELTPENAGTPYRIRRPPLKFRESEVHRFMAARREKASQPEKRKPRSQA